MQDKILRLFFSSPLRDHAAGDAVTGIAGGIGEVIVGRGVNDDGFSVRIIDRHFSRVESHALGHNLITSHAVFVDVKVG